MNASVFPQRDICASACGNGALPRFIVDPCKKEFKPGGICRLVFAACGVEIPSGQEQDLALWEAFLQKCQIRITGELMGEKGAAQTDKIRVTSCNPEIVSGRTETLTFSDYNNDSEFKTHLAFYNEFMNNPTSYVVGWFNAAGEFYGFFRYGLEVSEVVPNNNRELTHIDGTITIETKDMPIPVDIPGLQDLMIQYSDLDCESAGSSSGSSGGGGASCPASFTVKYFDGETNPTLNMVANDNQTLNVVANRVNCNEEIILLPMAMPIGFNVSINPSPVTANESGFQIVVVTDLGVLAGTYNFTAEFQSCGATQSLPFTVVIA